MFSWACNFCLLWNSNEIGVREPLAGKGVNEKGPFSAVSEERARRSLPKSSSDFKTMGCTHRGTGERGSSQKSNGAERAPAKGSPSIAASFEVLVMMPWERKKLSSSLICCDLPSLEKLCNGILPDCVAIFGVDFADDFCGDIFARAGGELHCLCKPKLGVTRALPRLSSSVLHSVSSRFLSTVPSSRPPLAARRVEDETTFCFRLPVFFPNREFDNEVSTGSQFCSKSRGSSS